MARKFNYEVDDYVKYEGNLSTLASILRDPDLGIIEEFETHFEEERVSLYLLRKKKHIWCDLRDIRPILTEPEHLKALNFHTVEVDGRKKYELGAVTISGAIIRSPSKMYLLQYCIGDFTRGIPNVDSYFENGDLNLQRFFADYPDVTNLNDLFTFLENQGRSIDREKILLQ